MALKTDPFLNASQESKVVLILNISINDLKFKQSCFVTNKTHPNQFNTNLMQLYGCLGDMFKRNINVSSHRFPNDRNVICYRAYFQITSES